MIKFVERTREDNGLQCYFGENDGGRYVAWYPGNATVWLDGDFLSTELREIADWMDAHQPKGENKS